MNAPPLTSALLSLGVSGMSDLTEATEDMAWTEHFSPDQLAALDAGWKQRFPISGLMHAVVKVLAKREADLRESIAADIEAALILNSDGETSDFTDRYNIGIETARRIARGGEHV